MDRYIFPALFDPGGEDGYTVTFPDLPGCITEGDTIEKALTMAKDALELHLYGLEADGEEIPIASNPVILEVPHGGFISLIEAWMPTVRAEMANLAVRKNLTIPKWLSDIAEERGVNYSQILQNALKEHLGVGEPAYIKK